MDVLASKYDCLLFDVDDTLYPLSSGLSKQCTKNIEEFMIQKLGVEVNKVSELNYFLYRNYGTSMAGLMAMGYDFDFDEYHSFVHWRLPYESLRPDPVLRNLLLSLPLQKVVFSNGDEVHVGNVLRRLGLDGCFERIIGFESLNPTNKMRSPNDENLGATICNTSDANPAACLVPWTPILCKPFEKAFQQAFKIANINPQRTLFFDDSIRNIETAKRVGLHTVLVGTSNRTQSADYALESIHNMKEAIPGLSDAKESSECVNYPEKVAIRTLA